MAKRTSSAYRIHSYHTSFAPAPQRFSVVVKYAEGGDPREGEVQVDGPLEFMAVLQLLQMGPTVYHPAEKRISNLAA
ncbi:MAG TPA: hypothetical protein PLH93_02350 [Flavobacteriales bacterium]|jgi:hypothetical protein|nr:hypothetical protein [Flavobacteriales bacterium]HQW85993.1 hypothetical protein [Flavobacteriales bacterium]